MAEQQALSAALAGCHAAVYAYGLVGPRLTGAAREAALAAMAAQRGYRDRLLALVGADASPAAAAYDPPFPVTDAASARRLAGLVEDRCAGLLAAAAGALTGADRLWAAAAAQQCAGRQVHWTGDAPVWAGAS